MNDRFWRNWRSTPWQMGVAMAFVLLLTSRGWNVIFMMAAIPTIIGVVGGVGWAARGLLARRGFTTAPTLVIVLQSVFWVAGWCFLLSMPADVGEHSASFIRPILPIQTAQAEANIQAVALGVVLVSALALLAVAAFLRPRAVVERADRPRRGARWWRIAALVFTPLLILGISMTMGSLAPSLFR